MRCQVMKPFEADGRRLERDEIVDADGWRLVQQLIEQRYLRPVTDVATDRTASAKA